MKPVLPEFLKDTPVPSLDEKSVLVWSGSLELGQSELLACESVLSADELERAQRFKFEKDREHFVAARGILRFLLGIYAQLEPRDLVFASGAHGKPKLSGCSEMLQFNVSHSHGVGAWALGFNRRVGVDLEWTQRSVDFDRIAQRFFSTKESTQLTALPKEKRREAFFRCWTRKEAFVKALGDGISFSLQAFDVGVGDKAEITRIEGDHEPAQWSMHAFDPARDYVAALAFEGQAKVRHHRLDLL